MGTRHFQKVIDKNGVTKVAQYGQWDGYPDGQGLDILEYLRNGDLGKYQKQLDLLKEITQKESAVVDKDINWTVNYPYLSRDCGAKIHKMIEEGNVKFVGFCSEKEANDWCEGFYTIDFQKNEFSIKYYKLEISYKLDKLPSIKIFLKDVETKEG